MRALQRTVGELTRTPNFLSAMAFVAGGYFLGNVLRGTPQFASAGLIGLFLANGYLISMANSIANDQDSMPRPLRSLPSHVRRAFVASFVSSALAFLLVMAAIAFSGPLLMATGRRSVSIPFPVENAPFVLAAIVGLLILAVFIPRFAYSDRMGEGLRLIDSMKRIASARREALPMLGLLVAVAVLAQGVNMAGTALAGDVTAANGLSARLVFDVGVLAGSAVVTGYLMLTSFHLLGQYAQVVFVDRQQY